MSGVLKKENCETVRQQTAEEVSSGERVVC